MGDSNAVFPMANEISIIAYKYTCEYNYNKQYKNGSPPQLHQCNDCKQQKGGN